MKLRPSLATAIESLLPENGAITAQSPAPAGDLVSRYSGRALTPLYPGIVRAKQNRHISAEQLSVEAWQRFPQRAIRLVGGFQPPDLSRTYILDLQNGAADVSQIVALLRLDPNVEYAEADELASISFVPNDPYFSSYGSWGQSYDDLWGIKVIGSPAAWDLISGNGITVAVVDTGLDLNHPDISSNIWTNSGEIAGNGIDDDGNGYADDIHGWNFVANNSSPLDDHGHGTHVSGTIAAAGNNGMGVIGVAWQSKVMPLKALDNTGVGYYSNLANAIVYAANNGADVISNSWGGWGTSATIADAVSYAYSLGAVIVAAAGNNGDDARNYTPANLDDVITVAATTPTQTFATFSNSGPKIDVAAPGVDILSLRAAGTQMGTPVGTAYTRASGTSMAAPHVSGVAALILAQHPMYSNEQVRQVLRASAIDLGTAGYDLNFGYGGLNASIALLITSPLEAKIRNIQYGSGPLSPITISGVAGGAGFASYTLEYGTGTQPTSWTTFQSSLTPTSGLLGQFDPSTVPSGSYTIRLTAYNASGRAFVDRASLAVNTLSIFSPVPSPYPSSSTTFKPGRVISVLGTAVGAGFQKFQVQWASGLNPVSGWQTTGITLVGGGISPVVNGPLASWDTSSITQAGYFTIRVSITANFSNQVSTTVYLEPDLLSVNWPVWMDQGPYFNSGVVPALNPDGTLRLAIASPNLGTVPGALWILGSNGSSQKTPLPSYGSFHQPSSAELGKVLGDDIVVADNQVVHVFPASGNFSSFIPAFSVDFMKHPLVVEDLDGDSRWDTIAIGNNYSNMTAEIFAWAPDGLPVSSNFPISLMDLNPLSGWYNHVRLLVGDFNGDGQKEIVAQEGLSSTTYTLRMFSNQGAARAWNVPTLTGIPFAMIAADLDHNGKLETILVSYSGTQATLHVFQPDGSERAGWPLLLPNPNQNAQAFLAVADFNRDGHEEIVLSHELDMYLLNADGTLFSSAWPLHTGTMGFGAVVIGDIDGDGRAEIVTTRNDVIATTYYDQKLLAIRSDGSVSRSWQLTGMNGYNLYAYPLPVIGDFDQNGITDIAVSYEVTGPAILPGITTILTTGQPFNSAANDWPMLLHDTRNTGVLRRSLKSTVALISSPNPSMVTEPVTFAASVTPTVSASIIPTGAVNFFDGSGGVGSCTLVSRKCTFQISAMTVGTHSIRSDYVGDSNFASSSAVVTQTVNKAATVTGLTASPNPSDAGQAVSFTATVSPVSPAVGIPSGNVTFYEANVPLGSGVLDAAGQVTITVTNLAVGTHNITCVYSGDAEYLSSNLQNPLAEIVMPITAVITASPSVQSPVFGQPVMLTASISPTMAGTPATGSVGWMDGAAPLGTCTLNSGTCQLQVPALSVGAHSITAQYSGDANFSSGNSAFSLSISRATTQVSLASSANVSVVGQPIVLTATLSVISPGAGIPAGTLTFYDGNTTIATGKPDSNGLFAVTIASLSAGNHGMSVGYSGDGNFSNSVSAAVSQAVNRAPTRVALTSGASSTVVGQSLILSASVSVVPPGAGVPTGTLTFYDGTTSIGSGVLDASGQFQLTTATLTAGTHNLSAGYGGDENFSGAVSAGMSQVVNAADFLLSGSAAQSVYAGSSATYVISVAPNPSPYNFAVTNFTCSGLPQAATCTITPISVTPGNTTASIGLTVSTTARSAAIVRTGQPFVGTFLTLCLPFAFLGAIGAFCISYQKGTRPPLVASALLLCTLWISCGGGSASPAPTPSPVPSGTPAGSYDIVVRATGADNVSHNTTISLKVN